MIIMVCEIILCLIILMTVLGHALRISFVAQKVECLVFSILFVS
jgi:hypothetical protein